MLCIDLDPASSLEANKTVRAFYVEEEDGLKLGFSRESNRIFCNPPGGKLAGKVWPSCSGKSSWMK